MNLPEGKNLVGAFHQPRARARRTRRCSRTLPDREYRCGLGEIAKYALMGDDFASPHVDALLARDPAVLAEVIARCVAIKARLRRGRRARAHRRARRRSTTGTRVAHALETATGHALLHGEAVAIGLVFAAQLGAVLERIDRPTSRAHRVARRGARAARRTRRPGCAADELLPIMARDKKSGGGLTFVLDGPSGIERVDDPDPGRGAQGARRGRRGG